jgi:acetyl esterase/lipase
MPAIRESETTYEGAGGSNLPMLISEPAEDVKAGIVMFHGGALHSGSPDDLTPHCRRLAARGIFAVSSGYRLIDQAVPASATASPTSGAQSSAQQAWRKRAASIRGAWPRVAAQPALTSRSLPR